MIQLTIGNSYSRITGLSKAQESELRDLLSYVPGGSSAYFSRFGPRKQSLLNKRGEFPSGLIGRLPPWAMVVRDERQKPPILDSERVFLPVLPRKSQKTALDKAIQYHRGIISMVTGSGKSLVIALIAARLNLKTLVIVPSLEIKKQLQASLAGLNKVRVENIDSSELPKLKDFDCLIIDEAHHVAAKTYRKLNKTAWTGIYYRFFLTATPFRNDPEEMLLFESIAGGLIYELSYKDAVLEKAIVPIEAYYIDVPKQKTEAETYRQVYDRLVVHNLQRNYLIGQLLLKLAPSFSTLCLVREVAHGKILAELTGIPFVSGADDESRHYIEQFKTGKITGLIGTEGILSEGVDTRPCEYVIVAGLGKAKSNFMQKCGRSVRPYPGKDSGKVIIIRDMSHKYLRKHFNAQKAILLEEYGCILTKLEVG